MARDYVKIYHLEDYLFKDVALKFAATGSIDRASFYMILIWKSPRAKTTIRDNLSSRAGTFAKAVKSISKALYESTGPDQRLKILMKDWGFRLPMATAILTVLYPNDFTVYDKNVCKELGKFEKLRHRSYSAKLWSDYQLFIAAVRAAVPGSLILRDKDRYLWGRSFYKQVLEDIR